jgi:hypothetical protein
MSSEDVLTYLVERQRVEGISASAMARRLEISETQWSHLRNGRGHRRLTVKQIERAIALYPELAERFAAPASEQVPA